ncbi:MAG TPA: amidohydrolase family protein [Myxococcota bacterium]
MQLRLAWSFVAPLALVVACGPSEHGARDAGSAVDVDAGTAGTVDAGTVDAGTVDAGTVDAGTVDAGTVDAGTVDAGTVDAGPGPHIVVGAADRVLLEGTVVTPTITFEGAVLVEGDTITCAAAGDECAARTGAGGATVVATDGIIAPGLIDTHNHILFDVFDEHHWTPATVYQDHTQWVNETRYKEMLDVKQCLANDSQGKPAWCAQTPYGTSSGSLRCEMDKFGELKGLIAGTTSIVGLPGTSGPCFGSLARSVDDAQNGLGADTIRTSAVFPPSRSTADSVCNELGSSVGAYLIHCGEGTDAKALAELTSLSSVSSTPGCLLAPQTTITHAVAFAATDFDALAQHGVNITWSPASNLFLYGATTDIPSALDSGIVIALGPDWSLGGSQNMLDEMRAADAYDNANWGDRLSPQDLVTMATKNGAHVLGLDHRLGQLQEGMLADIAVYHGDRSDPFASIVRATPADTELVMVGGTVLYGDVALGAAGPSAPGCETLDVCGSNKFLCAATASSSPSDKLGQSYADIRQALETAFTDVDAARPDDGFVYSPPTPLVRCGP